MNDTVQAVINVLKTDTEFLNSRVYEGYPPQFNLLPVAAVSLITRNDIGFGDGKGLQFFKDTVSVDVWAKDKVFEISEKVITLVYSLGGYISLTSSNVVEEEGVKHMNFTFSMKI